MKIVVYTGTSISHRDAGRILDADFRPPVKRSDVKKLISSSPDLIGIIDGVFFDRAAVAHREILEALENGIAVIGGSSMGALRASELDSYGMIGVGRVYEMYRDGILESDDEVAVTFDPETLQALSIPLVNVRMTLLALEDLGIVTEEQVSAVIDAARNLFYPDRSYRNIVNACVRKGIIKETEKEELLDSLGCHEVDVKREDAILVLERIKEMRLEGM